MTSAKNNLEWAIDQGLISASSNGTGEIPPGGDDSSANSTNERRPPSQATRLVELATGGTDGAVLWHTPDGEAYATIPISSRKENWPIRNRGFRQWLSRKYYGATGSTPNSQALQDAFSVLGGKALFDGTDHLVYTRLAEHEGAIYLDLVNEQWEVVEITPTGWKVTADPPVKFRRARGMLPLPLPQKDGRIKDLRRFVNVTDADWPLVVTWLIAALRPSGPYPILTLHGDQGSAKSTLARVLRGLVDPNKADLRSTPKDDRDLIIAATNGWLIVLDNLSHIQEWLSNALCRLATGGGFGTRTLYENDEETLFDAQRPAIINGIEELATRGDLLDRSIPLYLPSIDDDNRRPEKQFWPDYYAARPRILGVLLTALSMALQNVDTISLSKLPRMADFALWASAAAPALGISQPIFLNAYQSNRESANELALEASPVAQPLTTLLEDGEWEGTATQLMKELNQKVDEATQRLKAWPSSGRALSNALRRLAPNMLAKGIEVEFSREPHSRRRIVSLRKGSDIIVPTVPTVPHVSEPGDANDEMGTQPSSPEENIVPHNRICGDDGTDGDAQIPLSSNTNSG